MLLQQCQHPAEKLYHANDSRLDMSVLPVIMLHASGLDAHVQDWSKFKLYCVDAAFYGAIGCHASQPGGSESQHPTITWADPKGQIWFESWSAAICCFSVQELPV
ncbi:hypothetical protein ABBQ32_004203 [Trebouxia sp. C0010 RCD-2024]